MDFNKITQSLQIESSETNLTQHVDWHFFYNKRTTKKVWLF